MKEYLLRLGSPSGNVDIYKELSEEQVALLREISVSFYAVSGDLRGLPFFDVLDKPEPEPTEPWDGGYDYEP